MTRPAAPEVKLTRTISDYAQFGEAVVALALAALMVKAPFRLAVRSMALNRGASREDTQEAASIVRAIHRAARRVPWTSVCFDQGLALHWMLRRRGQRSILHYGIQQRDKKLSAHVWVSLGDDILIGEAEADSHTRVATFPAQPA